MKGKYYETVYEKIKTNSFYSNNLIDKKIQFIKGNTNMEILLRELIVCRIKGKYEG